MKDCWMLPLVVYITSGKQPEFVRAREPDGLFIPHLPQDKPISKRKRKTKSARQNTKSANILFLFCLALFVRSHSYENRKRRRAG